MLPFRYAAIFPLPIINTMMIKYFGQKEKMIPIILLKKKTKTPVKDKKKNKIIHLLNGTLKNM